MPLHYIIEMELGRGYLQMLGEKISDKPPIVTIKKNYIKFKNTNMKRINISTKRDVALYVSFIVFIVSRQHTQQVKDPG